MRKDKSYQIIKSRIGNLAIFWSSVRDKINIEEELGSDFEKFDSEKYIKTLIKYICHKEETLDGEDKPERITLTKSEIDNLSIEDIETIAEKYVNANEYLFREYISESKKSEEGHDVISGKYGKVEFPKKDDETYVDYLFRLEAEQNKKIRKEFENSFGKISSFSKSIQDSIRATASIGESLKKSISAIQYHNIPKVQPIIPRTPNLDFNELSKQIAKIEKQPISEVSTGIDELIEINAKSLEFLTETNRIQTLIANEIKASSITSSKLTKWNIAISIVVLLVSLSALFISSQSNRQTHRNNSNHVKLIVNSIEKLNSTTENFNERLSFQDGKNSYYQSQLDSLKLENKNLKDEVIRIRKLLTKTNNKKNVP